MRVLLSLLRHVLRGQKAAFAKGFVLAVTVLAMGAALLGLSGWFITAAAAAGLAGTGALFNVFGPSSMVRFLALGRTAARYGERLLTHDATLRALSALRVALMQGLLRQPYRQLERLRANAVLNRLTADVDALDGLLLRLVIPGLAGGLTVLAAGGILAWLVNPWVGLWVAAGWLILPTVVFAVGQRRARGPARRVEAALQALRARLVDMIAAREDLLVYGQLQRQADSVTEAQRREAQARRDLDRVERRMGFGLDLIGTLVVGGTLVLSAGMAEQGQVTAAQVGLSVLVALALGEAVAPVRRALTEVSRMVQAARRVRPMLKTAANTTAQAIPEGALVLEGVTSGRFAPVSLRVAPGETVALTGPSGQGKSTVLLMAAGVLPPAMGRVSLGGTAPEDEDSWRAAVTMLPQRHALVAGTIRENLALVAPLASEDEMRDALRAVHLDAVVAQKGGLDARLGFRGAGLSGGEGRRLALARAILSRPRVLLLDEPTEGLDLDLAQQVMTGLRAALPDAILVIAAHRAEEIAQANCVIALQRRPVTLSS